MQSTPSGLQQQGSRGTSPRICKELPPSPQDQLTESEIVEFGKIIGIDTEKEPHLLHLAREGLAQPLPTNWKPCHDPTRNAYFYLNVDNGTTQWEHPLNAVYKQKVAESRSSSATMISNSEFPRPKTSIKDFPPLRKALPLTPGGAAASGVNDPSDPLGHIKSLPPPKRLAPLPIGKPAQSLAPARQPLVRAKPMGLEDGRQLVPPRWIPDEDPPSIGPLSDQFSTEESVSDFGNQIEKPKVTGSGQAKSGQSVSRMRELFPYHNGPTKSSTPVLSSPKIPAKAPVKAKGNVQFNLEDDIDLKFETSSRGSSVQNDGSSSEQTSEDNGSEPISDKVKVNEPMTPRPVPVTIGLSPVRTQPTNTKVISSVTVSTAAQPKPNVAPQATSQPKPVATVATSPTKSAGPVTTSPKKLAVTPQPKPNVTTQATTQSKPAAPVATSQPKPVVQQMPAQAKANVAPVATFPPKNVVQQGNAQPKPPAPPATSQPKAVVPKNAAQEKGAGEDIAADLKKEEEKLRLKMEADLAELRQKLSDEQQEREKNLKQELDDLEAQNLQKLVHEKEMAKDKFENELSTVKAENEKLLAAEIEKLKIEGEKAISDRKTEIISRNEQILSEVSTEIKLLDKETLLAKQKTMLFEQIEQEIKTQSEEFRKSLKAEQQLELDRLKASHQQLLETLKQEWQNEIAKLGQDQHQALEELRQTFSDKKAKLEQEQKEAEKATNQREVTKEPTNQKPFPLESISPSMSYSLETKERELSRTKRKYKILQQRYAALKEEITNFPPFVPNEPETPSVVSEVDSFANSFASSGPGLPITNDRLSRALGALEILREQILDMDTVVKKPSRTEIELEQKPSNTERRSKHNLVPSSSPTFKSSRRLQTAVVQTKRTQPEPEPVRNIPDQYKAVREAKAFIKSQRHRLNLNVGQGHKVKDFVPKSETTESSGIGSLKRSSITHTHSPSPRSPVTSKVAKDIDTILSSLKKLDNQMQSLWTMVGTSGQGQSGDPPGFLTPLVHPAAPAALAQYNIMRENGALESLRTTSWHPAITTSDLRKRYTVTSGDPLTSAPAVPNSSILNNLEFNQASKHVLENELQTFEALQERIWKTYGPSYQEEDSIKAKTKDLRDWLHKF